MSHVIAKSRCPKCQLTGNDRSGNNLAEYSDSHFFCFRCGYYIPSSTTMRIKHALSTTPIRSESNQPTLELPEDVSIATHGTGFVWLQQYGITTTEIICNRIMWSEERKLLCFPLLVNNEVVAWQARNFNPEKKYKYLTKGNVQDNYFLFGNGNTIVLVEDVVSAIKVSRHGVYGYSVLGSVISPKTIQRLTHISDNFLLWLDPDKQKEAIKYSSQLRQMGYNCSTILSDKDPKEHIDDYIKDKLNEYQV